MSGRVPRPVRSGFRKATIADIERLARWTRPDTIPPMREGGPTSLDEVWSYLPADYPEAAAQLLLVRCWYEDCATYVDSTHVEKEIVESIRRVVGSPYDVLILVWEAIWRYCALLAIDLANPPETRSDPEPAPSPARRGADKAPRRGAKAKARAPAVIVRRLDRRAQLQAEILRVLRRSPGLSGRKLHDQVGGSEVDFVKALRPMTEGPGAVLENTSKTRNPAWSVVEKK